MKIGLAVVLQVIIIAGMIIVKLITLADGGEILIHLLPVDPRDPLRGDYVTYRHDLSTVSGYYYRDEEQFREGETVYVPVVESAGFAFPGELRRTKPADGIFLKGRIMSVDIPAQGSHKTPTYRLEYGIEQYFIPEGKGQIFNTWAPDRQAFIKVAVDSDGSSVLKQLYIDGKPWP